MASGPEPTQPCTPDLIKTVNVKGVTLLWPLRTSIKGYMCILFSAVFYDQILCYAVSQKHMLYVNEIFVVRMIPVSPSFVHFILLSTSSALYTFIQIIFIRPRCFRQTQIKLEMFQQHAHKSASWTIQRSINDAALTLAYYAHTRTQYNSICNSIFF